MKTLSRLSFFLFRLLVTSILALCIQILLFIHYPDWLLEVQEMVKYLTIKAFEHGAIKSAYRAAFNLLNGDGILVHTVFVMLSFTILYVAFLPLRLLGAKSRRR